MLIVLQNKKCFDIKIQDQNWLTFEMMQDQDAVQQSESNDLLTWCLSIIADPCTSMDAYAHQVIFQTDRTFCSE